MLLERDGVYSWHLPVNPPQRTRSLEKKPRTARFEIDVQPRPTKRGASPPARETAHQGAARRSRAGCGASDGVPFVAPAILEKAIEKMEEHVRPGWSTWPTPTWRSGGGSRPSTSSTCRPTGRSGCCCSSTAPSPRPWAAFGALGIDENGKGFLRTAISAYDAVIGFDHKTLSVDPRQNAEDLLKPAQDAPPGRRARHRHRHPQPRWPGDPIVRRAGAARVGLAGHGRQRRLRRRPPTPARTWPTRSGGATSSTSTPTSPRSARAGSRCCRAPRQSPRSSAGW